MAPTLEELLCQGRGLRCEVLSAQASPRRIAECLAALANAEGGWVLLVEDGGVPVASSADEAQPSSLNRALEALLLCEPRLVAPCRAVNGWENAGWWRWKRRLGCRTSTPWTGATWCGADARTPL